MQSLAMSQIDIDVRTASSTGLEATTAAALAYLAGPFSALIILLAERENRFVRFHAWQSLLALGGLGVMAAVSLLAAFLGLFVSPSLFRVLYVLSAICAMAWVGVWALCLWSVLMIGNALKLPWVGAIAENRVARTT